MSKKDYVAMAKVLDAFRRELLNMGLSSRVDDAVVKRLIVPLAHIAREDNPRFDYSRFLTACGVQAT